MSLIDSVAIRLGYQKIPPVVAKAHEPERVAQDPLALAYRAIGSESGLRRASGITMKTLRRMAQYNWVDRTCIVTLRDEVTAIPFSITPIDPHKPYNADFQNFLEQLLRHPDPHKGSWRKLIDKVVEDILIYDQAGIEKVRNQRGQVVELYHVDGSSLKQRFDDHGLPGTPAYQQFVDSKVGSFDPKPVAEWDEQDLIFLMWNPQGSLEAYGSGLSPVEAGLAVGTSFLQAEAYNLQFFQSNSIPPVIINLGKDVPPGEVDKFRMFLASEMRGQDGFHKPAVGSFGDDFDIKTLMQQPSEMGFKSYVEWQMRWKVALYRMSPQDIGFALDQYKVEGQVQQELSKSKAIDSLKGVLAEYINNEIVGDAAYGNLSENLQFAWIDADTVDPLKQAQIDEIYLRNGVNSINEVRQRNGDDPIEGGIKPTINLGTQLIAISQNSLVEDENEVNKAHEVLDDSQASQSSLTSYDYQSTQLDFPEEISRQIRALGDAIPDSDVSINPDDPTYGREHDIHVTVLYGLDPTIAAEEVAAVAAGTEPITVTLGETSIFEGEAYDVLKIEVDGQGIHDLHDKLNTHLNAPGNNFPTYIPHVTIAYLKKGAGAKYAGNRSLVGTQVTFNLLKFSNQQGEKTIIPLAGATERNLASSVSKSVVPQEGQIVSLASNPTAIAWMDDRGVTQPLFVTDYGKTKGFTVKPDFLDDRKGQEPPEQEVAERLRRMGVNTPEVRIMSYDEVLALLPTECYGLFTKWINVEAPFDSKEWRDRWGTTRKAQSYIVTGYLDAVDLGNSELQAKLTASPESYLPAIEDWAKVWLAEWQLKLGDRKPGHYLLTASGQGFGVDYQFYQDENSWLKSNHWLPVTLQAIEPSLADALLVFIKKHASVFGTVAKSLPNPADWQKEATLEGIEQKLATKLQRQLTSYYRAVVHVRKPSKPAMVRKANVFDPDQDYLIGGDGVYQNGVKYPLSVLPKEKQDALTEVGLQASDYRDAYDFGVNQAQLTITTKFPDISVHAPELLAKPFEDRVNYLAGELTDTLKNAVNQTIVNGIDGGKTYGEIADAIQQTLAVDPNAPSFPQYRAVRIARTESQWAINTGMLAQYQTIGAKLVDVDVAPTACPICQGIASGNPYTLGEAQDLIPAHSNCRCVWVNDWTSFTKALPNVVNDVTQTAFVDVDQLKHPVKGEPAFTSFGENLDEPTRKQVTRRFAEAAKAVADDPEAKIDGLSSVAAYANLREAVAEATKRQEHDQDAAFLVCAAATATQKNQYQLWCFHGGVA